MFENKKIFVLGIARSGYAAAKVLAEKKNKVTIYDKNVVQDEVHIKELRDLGVEIILGEISIDIINDIDYVIKNPGVNENNELIVKAHELNIPVINEVELGYLLLPKDVTLIGVTGSNGKTTTTTLIYELLKNAKLPVILAGNMGYPLCSVLDEIKSGDILLMEISIQQLTNFDKFKTNISVFTNIYEAHLDLVGTKENYIKLKRKIFAHHTKDDYAILNLDNEDVVNNTNDMLSHKGYFSKNKKSLCHLENNNIIYNDKKIINISELKLTGMHNYENVMASVMVAKRLNISDDVIIKTLKEFSGVEHRIEFVREYKGIKIYNDSKSTNVKATEIALSSFQSPTILLLGGLDRGHSFDNLISFMNHVKLVVSYGETKNRIKEFCDKLNIKCIVVDNLKDATDEAFNNAVSGDTILLSPACASWDQYKDFEERGRIFKEYVNGRQL